ncbi:hypothetical protein L596_028881 [Steinernema carpocapsae]|uniref:Uncharacterized protein n=1 Tax=Steinernema carpocapsae TaxID=34508 RepID=A0A4U5LZM7_STECR|nr:hypothetical protein L596_028881 [Steinernema carpocapsae]
MLPQRRLFRDLLAAVLLSAFISSFSVLGTALDDGQSLPSKDRTPDIIRRKNENINYTFYDNSAGVEIEGTGFFHRYDAVLDEIEKLIAEHVDWCGFGHMLKENAIDDSWESTEKAGFEQKMKDHKCYERKKKGLYASPGEREEAEKKEAKASNTATIVIIVLAIMLAIAFVAIIALTVVVFVTKKSPAAARSSRQARDQESEEDED